MNDAPGTSGVIVVSPPAMSSELSVVTVLISFAVKGSRLVLFYQMAFSYIQWVYLVLCQFFLIFTVYIQSGSNTRVFWQSIFTN